MLVNGLMVRLFGLMVVMFSKVLNYGWLQLQCDIHLDVYMPVVSASIFHRLQCSR